MEGNSNIGVSQITPAVHVELADSVHVKVRAEWLVQELDCGHSRVRGMVVADLVKNFGGMADGIALCPSDVAILARVVEAVLRVGSYALSTNNPPRLHMGHQLTTVQVDHDLQASIIRPVKSFAELVISSLYVRLTIDWDDAPVPNWDSHVVQPGLRHLVEVVLCNPRVPVILQLRLGSILAKYLCERPFVLGGIALKDTWGDPRLEDEPTPCVYATDLLTIVVEEW